MVQPMPTLAAMATYRAERSLIPTFIRLDGNEGRLPPPSILEAVTAAGPELLRRYPSKASLESKLAARFEIAPEQLIVTNGADDALDRIARAFAGTGRSLVAPGPTFEMIERFVRIAGGDFIEVPWWEEPLPVAAIEAAVRDDTAVIAVVTPNNPTGLSARGDAIQGLAARFPDRLIVVDLAYAEFADEDLTEALLRVDNVVMTRTLSKAWSLAGARVGYAFAGNRSIIDHLRNAGGPYPVGGPSLAIAEAWLDAGLDHVEESRRVVLAERERLSTLLSDLWADPFPSQANYVCARFRDVQWVHDVVASVGIAIRAFTDKPKLSDCARITCPQDDEIMNRLENGLRAALRPTGIVVQETLAAEMDLEALRKRGIAVQVAHTAPRAEPKWWIARYGFETARSRMVPSFALGLESRGAQEAGAARSFADLDALMAAWDAARGV